MKQKIYSIALPASFSTSKSYIVQSSLSGIQQKSYGIESLRLTVFRENNKAYPFSLPATSRVQGTVYEDELESADRIKKVYDTLGSYYQGGSIKTGSRSAVIHSLDEASLGSRIFVSDISVTQKSTKTVPYVTQLDELLAFTRDTVYDSSLTHKFDAIRCDESLITIEYSKELSKADTVFKASVSELDSSIIDNTYSITVCEDEKSMRLLKLNHGQNVYDLIQAEYKNRTYLAQVVTIEIASFVNKIKEALLEEFSDFAGTGYLTELLEYDLAVIPLSTHLVIHDKFSELLYRIKTLHTALESDVTAKYHQDELVSEIHGVSQFSRADYLSNFVGSHIYEVDVFDRRVDVYDADKILSDSFSRVSLDFKAERQVIDNFIRRTWDVESTIELLQDTSRAHLEFESEVAHIDSSIRDSLAYLNSELSILVDSVNAGKQVETVVDSLTSFGYYDRNVEANLDNQFTSNLVSSHLVDLSESDQFGVELRYVEAENHEMVQSEFVHQLFETEFNEFDGANSKAYLTEMQEFESFGLVKNLYGGDIDQFSPASKKVDEIYAGVIDIEKVTHRVDTFLALSESLTSARTQQHEEIAVIDTPYLSSYKSRAIDTSISEWHYSVKTNEYLADLNEMYDSTDTRFYEVELYDLTETYRNMSWVTDVTVFDESKREMTYVQHLEQYTEFDRLMVYQTELSSLDNYSRIAVEAIKPDDFTYYSRVSKFANMEETVTVERDMVYNITIDEFIPVEGPNQKEYTWLWHSKPAWWNVWNYRKTK